MYAPMVQIKPKIGRPLKEDALRNRINIRLSDEEFDALEEACKEQNMTKTELIRAFIHRYLM